MVSQILQSRIPERIGRLNELSHNLWWSWHNQARDLFRALDYPLWRESGHNPVKQLVDISPGKLQAAAGDPSFLTLYDSVMSTYDAEMSSENTWFSSHYANLLTGPVAYFSMEFALHSSLPIYAGGLGILAGDLCKEASDMGLPLVGVGFMYPQGYFLQHISAEGWQQEIYQQLNFNEAPINPVISATNSREIASVKLANRKLRIAVWQVKVGRVNIYLMDTNIEGNAPEDRELSARLYTADREVRIQQEIVLGIGGVRVLRALGIEPAIWHANEGHTAFMMVERIREDVERGVPFQEALKRTRLNTAFTTHTPVPAGHDVFQDHLVEKYFREYWESMGISRENFLNLGSPDNNGNTSFFNMTALSLKTSDERNAVSKLHEVVSKRMWSVLWPQRKESDVPILGVTNGVHLPTWIAHEMEYMFDKHLGSHWKEKQLDSEFWKRVLDIPDMEFWSVHQSMKSRLFDVMLERAQKRWAEGDVTAQQVVVMGSLLSTAALTLGFVRRFTEYKRPDLIFRDIQRLKRILNNPLRPVQLVFAGKSHPADFAGKYLLHKVYSIAEDREFQGRIAFIENYDMHVARYLTHGVDVWLNTPRRLQEASGTSGMKAAENGVPHLSVRDGWWEEGYNGANGWAIGPGPEAALSDRQDDEDAESLYSLLEEQVIPLYYDQDRSGIPHGWIRVAKEAVRIGIPGFSACRMVRDYIEKMYIPISITQKSGDR